MIRILPVALVLVAAIACKESITASGDRTEYAGNYAMQSINGGALPFTVLTTDDVKLEITYDTIYLSTSGNFRDVTRYRRTTKGVVDYPADTLDGNWTVRGQTVTMDSNTGFTFQGNVAGNTLTILGTGITTVYAR